MHYHFAHIYALCLAASGIINLEFIYYFYLGQRSCTVSDTLCQSVCLLPGYLKLLAY